MELYSALLTIVTSTLTSSVALLLPALGENVSERSGVLNIGVEGYMIVGSITSYLVYVSSGNIWLGLLMGMLAGGLLSLVHAVFSITLKCNQVICGIGIWLFGLGISGYIFRLLDITTITEKFPPCPIPLLEKIPFLGPAFFDQNIFVYISLALVLIFSVVLSKTSWGLLNRGAGDSPFSTDMAGHNVFFIRYISTFFCGLMSGLGGAYLAIGILSRFSEGMTAGRGFIAICIVIFGGWNPWKILFGALFFSFIDSFQLYLQVWTKIPYPFLVMLPYLLTIIVVTYISRRSKNIPRKLAIPYIRGGAE